MPGRRRFRTLEDLERHKKKGFGSGELETYMPWLLVRDVPSQGRSHMLYSDLCKRDHHLLSDNEYRYFLIQWWSGQNTDIRECYPVPLASSLAIAAALGYRHPVYRGTKTPVVMTTDFLFTRIVGGRRVLVARSIKSAEAIDDPNTGKRTLEKEEIQRVHWTMSGVDWGLVTDRQINRTLADNLDWLVGATKVEEAVTDRQGFDALRVHAAEVRWVDRTLAAVLKDISARINRPFEQTVNLLKLSLWHRLAEMDLTKARIHTAEPLWEVPRFGVASLELRRAA